MSSMPLQYEVEPLGEQHNRAAFSCGVEALDRYFREQAGQESRRDVARVFVLHMRGAQDVAGFYMLSAISIEPKDLPPALTKRLPRYPTLPTLLVGRLAVDQRYQGQGVGRALLMSALARSLGVRTQIGAVGVIVDAKDERARTFYEQYGFQRFRDDLYRLVLFMKTIEQLIPPQSHTLDA